MKERTYIFFGSILLIIFILKSIYIFISNKVNIDGMQLYTIQKQLNYYNEQNVILREKLLNAESLTTIAKEADRLGFTPAHYTFIK